MTTPSEPQLPPAQGDKEIRPGAGAKKLRLVLGAQLLFFAVWGGWLLSSRNAASPEFYLETEPADPRDLLSGTFVALNYAISAPWTPTSCSALKNSALSLFIRLEHKGRTANTEHGTVPVRDATECSDKAPSGPGWARATFQPAFAGRVTALYGIERFYLNENDPRKDARSGAVLAKVKIDGSHQLVLLDLVKKI